jgi:hypothetical protein
MPPRQLRDFLPAHRAETVVLVPVVAKLPYASQVRKHLHAFALLEVLLPPRVIRIGLAPDFDVPPDGRRCRVIKPCFARPPLIILRLTEEPPVLPPLPAEVLPLDPATACTRPPIPRLSDSIRDAGRPVRYCVSCQAVFAFCAHSGSNGLPVLSTP